MITSGSCRNMFFNASAKSGVSVSSSRCETAAFPSANRYSMGSSMVTMCTCRCSMTLFRIAARVVDLPDPVGPVIRTRPAGRWTKVSRTSGRFRSPIDGSLKGMRRKTAAREPRWM